MDNRHPLNVGQLLAIWDSLDRVLYGDDLDRDERIRKPYEEARDWAKVELARLDVPDPLAAYNAFCEGKEV